MEIIAVIREAPAADISVVPQGVPAVVDQYAAPMAVVMVYAARGQPLLRPFPIQLLFKSIGRNYS